MRPARASGSRAWLAPMLVAAVLLAGCDEPADTGGGTDTGDGGAYPNLPRVELPAEEQAAYDALLVDLVGADGVSGRLGTYWPPALASVSIGSLYDPLTGVTSYEGAPQQSGCGPLSTENAWYCSTDKHIYYDDNFLRAMYQTTGMAGPTVLMAHEYGHHIQSIMGLPQFSVQAELQADCLAGMFFGQMQPPAGEPDLRYAGATIFWLGDDDYRASEWFERDVHGAPSWRSKAFLDGMLGEGAYCRDYESWTERGTFTLGTYRWLPAPAIEVRESDGGVLIATLRGRAAYLAPYAAPPAETTALAYLPAVFDGWLGTDFTPVGSPTEIETGDGTSGILGGTGAVQGYQFIDEAGSTQHGLLFVHVATTGEAALVSVTASGPPPASDVVDPAWNSLVNYLFVVAYSLCPPDGAGALCLALGDE